MGHLEIVIEEFNSHVHAQVHITLPFHQVRHPEADKPGHTRVKEDHLLFPPDVTSGVYQPFQPCQLFHLFGKNNQCIQWHIKHAHPGFGPC